MSDPAMIESISAVTLATHDMARAVRFYRMLGFEVVHGGDTGAFTSFRAGRSYLNLVTHCSCPITKSTAAQSYQILGPYPCDKSFFKYCKGTIATSKTGSTIYVGAPVGTAAALAVQLNGKVPPLNECSPPGSN